MMILPRRLTLNLRLVAVVIRRAGGASAIKRSGMLRGIPVIPLGLSTVLGFSALLGLPANLSRGFHEIIGILQNLPLIFLHAFFPDVIYRPLVSGALLSPTTIAPGVQSLQDPLDTFALRGVELAIQILQFYGGQNARLLIALAPLAGSLPPTPHDTAVEFLDQRHVFGSLLLNRRFRCFGLCRSHYAKGAHDIQVVVQALGLSFRLEILARHPGCGLGAAGPPGRPGLAFVKVGPALGPGLLIDRTVTYVL